MELTLDETGLGGWDGVLRPEGEGLGGGGLIVGIVGGVAMLFGTFVGVLAELF